MALCLPYSIPTTWTQLVGWNATQSDYAAHLLAVEHLQHGHLDVSHFVFHVAVGLLGFLITNLIATVVVITLAHVALGVVMFGVLCDAFEVGTQSGARAARLAVVVTAALLLSAPINVFTFPRLYLGYIPTTIYHSPTVQVLRPLALLLFLRLDRDVLADAPARRGWPSLLGLALLGVVTTLTMPSFSIVVVPAMMVMALVYHRTILQRWKLAHVLVLGLSIGAVLAWETLFLFPRGNPDEGVAVMPFALASFFEPSRRLLVGKLVLSVVFPAVAVLLNHRAALADRRLVFSYTCFLISLVYYLVLAERGARLYHGNFLWGAMVSMLLVFLSTSAMLARQPRAERVAWMSLALHVVCGVIWLAAANSLFGHPCGDGFSNWCW